MELLTSSIHRTVKLLWGRTQFLQKDLKKLYTHTICTKGGQEHAGCGHEASNERRQADPDLVREDPGNGGQEESGSDSQRPHESLNTNQTIL